MATTKFVQFFFDLNLATKQKSFFMPLRTKFTSIFKQMDCIVERNVIIASSAEDVEQYT